MHLFHLILIATAWLIACSWLLKFLEAARGLARVPDLSGADADAIPEGEPSVAVIVPARNEEANVGDCLRSLVEQDYGRLRVIAVDDRSTDGTGGVIDLVAGQSGARVEAVHVRELPPGWLGKTHAMACGAKRAMEAEGCDYLLFTDADIYFEPSAIRRAVAFAAQSRADHFVLLPTMWVKTAGEGMLLSFLQVISMWAIRMWRVPDPKAMRDAIGVGAFNLIRREAYERLGGFEAARMEIVEDLDLGRRIKRAGLRQRVATGQGLVCLHWASGVAGIVQGMTKNIFAVFWFRPELLLLGSAGLAVSTVAPVFFLGLAGARVAALATLAAVAGLYWLSSRTTRISAWYAVTFPVAGAVVVYSMLRSMVVTFVRGGVTWRGTFYSLRQLREHGRGKLGG